MESPAHAVQMTPTNRFKIALQTIKIKNQAHYKEYNIQINHSDITKVSDGEIRFQQCIHETLTKFYTDIQKNLDNETYWNQIVGGALGLALIVCGEKYVKAGGVGIVAASVASAAKKEEKNLSLKQIVEAFLKVINTPEAMDKLMLSISSHLNYRFELLIKLLANNKNGVDKLAKILSKRIMVKILENTSEFIDSAQLLNYVLSSIIPNESNEMYQKYLFLDDTFITKDNNRISIKDCFLESSATTEAGSIFVKANATNPFEYPFQKFKTEDDMRKNGYITYLDVPVLWDSLIIRNQTKHQPCLDDLVTITPKLNNALYTRYKEIQIEFEKIKNLSSLDKSKLKSLLKKFNGCLEFLCLLKIDNIKEFNNSGMSKIDGNIHTGKTDAIQLLLIFQNIILKTREFEKYLSQITLKLNQNGKTEKLIVDFNRHKNFINEALKDFAEMHKFFVSVEKSGINAISQQNAGVIIPNNNDCLIDMPDDTSHARLLAPKAPSKVTALLNAMNPLHINQSANQILDSLNIENSILRILIKGGISIGACIVALVAFPAEGVFACVCTSGTALVLVYYANNAIGAFLEYKKSYTEYSLNKLCTSNKQYVANKSFIKSHDEQQKELKEEQIYYSEFNNKVLSYQEIYNQLENTLNEHQKKYYGDFINVFKNALAEKNKKILNFIEEHQLNPGLKQLNDLLKIKQNIIVHKQPTDITVVNTTTHIPKPLPPVPKSNSALYLTPPSVKATSKQNTSTDLENRKSFIA